MMRFGALTCLGVEAFGVEKLGNRESKIDGVNFVHEFREFTPKGEHRLTRI